VPVYAHIPLILKPHSMGTGKMSKRDKGALIEEYQQRHFLPEAVRNYLCLIGWSPKDDREVLTIEEIIQLFDLPGINQTNAHFDDRKMAHINMIYVRHLTADKLVQQGTEILTAVGLVKSDTPAEYTADVLKLCQEKIRALEELPHFCGYFFTSEYPMEAGALEKLKKKGEPLTRLTELHAMLAAQEDFSEVTLEAKVKQLAEDHAVKTADYIHAARLAVSGMSVGPSFYGMLKVLGKTRVLARLAGFLAAN
jgi:glutamyl/glutaminyl-tRNA synthetase